MALTENTQFLDNEFSPAEYVKDLRVKGSTKIFKGSIVAISAGYAVPKSSTFQIMGRALEEADNSSGSDADISVPVRINGKEWMPHSGAAVTDIGNLFTATADDVVTDFTAGGGQYIGRCIDYRTDELLIDFSQGGNDLDTDT